MPVPPDIDDGLRNFSSLLIVSEGSFSVGGSMGTSDINLVPCRLPLSKYVLCGADLGNCFMGFVSFCRRFLVLMFLRSLSLMYFGRTSLFLVLCNRNTAIGSTCLG